MRERATPADRGDSWRSSGDERRAKGGWSEKDESAREKEREVLFIMRSMQHSSSITDVLTNFRSNSLPRHVRHDKP